MNIGLSRWRRAAVLIFFALTALPAGATAVQPTSVIGSSLTPPAGGAGDSMMPIISADGRYVLFASTANNLMLNTNGNPIPTPIPPTLNVYLRDRTNGTTTLVSVNLSGIAGGNGDSIATAISTNGQFALFESSASDLVAHDTNGSSDVFVRDVINGITTLVSVSTNGGSATAGYYLVGSRSSVMTPDGRYVAFVSAAINLVPNDTNRIADIFVRDLQTGTTMLASDGATATGSSGSGMNSGASELPYITPDGRYVAFFCTATNLVPGVTNTAGEIYVRDLVGGTTIWASTNAHSILQSIFGPTNTIAYSHVISDDGQFVAYEASPTSVSYFNGLAAFTIGSPAPGGVILRYSLQTGLTDIVNTNAPGIPTLTEARARTLDMTPDGRFIAFVGWTNKSSCIYVWDAESGITTLVSGDVNNSVPTNSTCDSPTMDSSGRFVAFTCSTNLTTNPVVGDYHLYARDTESGITTLVDADTNGVGYGVRSEAFPRLSADGRFIAFETLEGNLVPNDNNHDYDVFVRDLTTNTVELISAHAPGLQTLTPNEPSDISMFSISTNGRVAFMSEADNLVTNDTNGLRDVFVRDLLVGTNLLVSVATNGASGGGFSTDPAISADGRYVTFTSSATNLVVGDNNNAQDVFLRDLQNGTTVLVSVSTDGIQSGSGDSYSSTISANGRYVLFRSRAQNLMLNYPTSGNENLFWRDTQSSTTSVLTTNTSSTASFISSMTPDGHFIAFCGSDQNMRVWDSQAATMVYATNEVSNVAISADGTRVVYSEGNPLQWHAVDLTLNTNWVINFQASATSHPGLRFSADARYLTYVGLVNNTNQVYLYDFQTGTNLLVSTRFNSTNAASSPSDSPDISPDGRFVAYRSSATNIVQADSNGVPDVFLYDRVTGATTLLSVSQFGNWTADNRSLKPVFGGDSQTLFFQSWASDVATNDFNHNGDVLAYSLYSTNSILPFSAAIAPPSAPGQFPTITWPVMQGKAYQAQFKDSLTDPIWQNLNGNLTLIGTIGYLYDFAPNPNQRFYRILLSN